MNGFKKQNKNNITRRSLWILFRTKLFEIGHNYEF